MNQPLHAHASPRSTRKPVKLATRSSDAIVRFMQTIGHTRDAEFYLELFTAERPESFAMVVADEALLQEELDALILDLHYLVKLGLFPVLVFQTSKMAWTALDTEQVFHKAKLKTRLIDREASISRVSEAIRDKHIPIFIFDSKTAPQGALLDMACALETKKMIFLNPRGALRRSDTGDAFDMLNLLNLEEVATAEALLNREDLLRFHAYRELLMQTPHRLHIAVTAPMTILRELFTVKGAGTLIYKGSKVDKLNGLASVDTDRLKQLIELSFNKSLRGTLDDLNVDVIYLDEAYQGAAFVRTVGEFGYLSKFAVGLAARGLGVGRDIWQAVVSDYPKLLWRADPDNFISSWYAKQCDGMQKGPKWNVYWIGLSVDEIENAIRYAREQPADFV